MISFALATTMGAVSMGCSLTGASSRFRNARPRLDFPLYLDCSSIRRVDENILKGKL